MSTAWAIMTASMVLQCVIQETWRAGYKFSNGEGYFTVFCFIMLIFGSVRDTMK